MSDLKRSAMKYILSILIVISLCGCFPKSETPHYVLSFGNLPDVKISVDGQPVIVTNDGSGRLQNIDDLIKNDPFTITFTIMPNGSIAGIYAFGLTRFVNDNSKIIFEEQVKLPLKEKYERTWTIQK
jgi:hypothetical protein